MQDSSFKIIVIIASALILVGLIVYFNHRKNEQFTSQETVEYDQNESEYYPLPTKKITFRNESNGGSGASDGSDGSDVPTPYDKIKPEDLLPKGSSNSKWAQANPAGQGDVKDQNYLTAGYHVGFNTKGSSLRNPSHDIRATIPNPRKNVSPWNQTTIEPDLNRLPLE